MSQIANHNYHGSYPVMGGIDNADCSTTPFLFPRSTDDEVKNSTIMIVDDEAVVTHVVQRHLEMAGFANFHLVNDSSKAIEEIRRVLPDLVLLDIRMPVDGLSILNLLRQDDELTQIPVVTLTSDTDAKTKMIALNLGANDFLTKPVDISELVARVRNTLSGKAYRDRLSKYSSQLESDILRDELTQVANRRAFDYELNRRMIEWSRQRVPLGLLLVDIDYFKLVNDQYGHQVGDDVLREVAQEISKSIRDMDLVARYGGEEFGIILPCTGPNEVIITAERVREAIQSRSLKYQGKEVKVTVSVGGTNARAGDDTTSLIKRTDMALYTSKQHGRNRTSIHNGTVCEPINFEESQIETMNPGLGFGDGDHVNAVDDITQSNILVVDDEPTITLMVKKLLKGAGYDNVLAETDSTKAFDRVLHERPDLILLDIRMPQIDGLEILRRVRSNEMTKRLPVVFLTSTTDSKTKIKALNDGATDFLPKPVNGSELIARVKNTLLAKRHIDVLADYSSKLEHEVRLRTAELSASRREAIQCLARAAEIRDDQTGQHVFRVGRYAAIIAKQLGYSGPLLSTIEYAAQLHDVGKIGIPDDILKKPAKLTIDEFEIMKSHCSVGNQIIGKTVNQDKLLEKHASLGESIFEDCNSPIMRMAAVIAATHHEKWDGSGYPKGLAGEDIPVEGRITAVADVFDAVSSARPYKTPFPVEACFKIILDGAGSHFDPTVVEAFLDRKEEVIEVYQNYGDKPRTDGRFGSAR